MRPFLYLVPVIFLFALGVLFRSTEKAYINACGCDPKTVTGDLKPDETEGNYEGQTVSVPTDLLKNDTTKTAVLGIATPSERWIDVDISEQKLRAWNKDQLFLETPVSTGLPGLDTPRGEFRIWMKIRATRMKGGEGRYAYDLPNVPYVMFFSNDKVAPGLGYSLHGTYWHSDFGKVHSHGCVNLPTPVAKELYEWTSPTVPTELRTIRASLEDPGTRIVIHE